MFRRYQTIGYGLVFLLLLGFLLSWKILIAPERAENIAEIQKRIDGTAANLIGARETENTDDSLRIYGVYVARTTPFKDPFFGYGIYLGQGLVLTAAHLVGRWPSYTNLRVIIAGQDLPAKVIKQGSPEQTDLALLSVDQEQLPISLRLRRSPQCKEPLRVGTNVVVVSPERVARSQIISPLLIPPEYQAMYRTLINEPYGSGSGVFFAERKCLIGIMSKQITKYAFQRANGAVNIREDGFAGYFAPVSKGATFVPPQYRF